MTVVELLARLSKLDIRLWVEDGKLGFSAPNGVFTAELKQQVSTLKQDIIKFLQQAEKSTKLVIKPVAREQDLRLSFAQQRLWFLHYWQPHSTAYNIPVALRLKGKLSVEKLSLSMQKVINRHESLRTNFIEKNGTPYQVIAPESDWSLPVEEIALDSTEDINSLVNKYYLTLANYAFDLEHEPLFQAKLLKLPNDEYIFLLNIHHIVADGWSLGVVIRELATVYSALIAGNSPPLTGLRIQYADYAEWQRQWLSGDVLEKQLAYWREKLADVPQLNLPIDYLRPPQQSHRGRLKEFTLPAEIAQALHQLSRDMGVTLFMLLLAVYKTLLYRYSGQKDICVGSPVANRSTPDLEALIGFFVNTLPLRTEIDSKMSFREFVALVQRTAMDAYEHQEVPFERIVEELKIPRDASHSPVFQVLFSLQNNPIQQKMDLSGLEISPWLETPIETAKFDLEMSLSEVDNHIVGGLVYNTELFAEATIDRMLESFQILLRGVLKKPEQTLDQLSLLSSEQEQILLEKWCEPWLSLPSGQCIHQRFEQQVRRKPDAIAIIDGERRLTYQLVNQRANQLAFQLRNLGLEPEDFVGVCLPRSADLFIALMAVFKAGATYIPLDPNYPTERVAYMLSDSQARVLVTQRHWLAQLTGQSNADSNITAQIYCIDAEEPAHLAAPDTDLDNVTTEKSLAYVIYTSGSTGLPKGVAIEHRNVIALTEWASGVYSTEALCGVLWSTSVCFDLSIYEMFVTTGLGGSIIVAENALDIADLPAINEVTLINTVPSAIAALQRDKLIPDSVKVINLAGEALKQSLVDSLYNSTSVKKIYDLYGPSEDTTYSTFVLREPQGLTSIGRPVANTRAYVLDDNRQLMPIGAVGELYLGGDGLARGYLNRDQLTAEKFIANPFQQVHPQVSRVYATGDLVRYLPNGCLQYLGRIDHQVKIRGFRIEIGEIEAAIVKLEPVKTALVTVYDFISFGKILVAYAEVDGGEQNFNIQMMQAGLREHLPDYMIPPKLIVMEAFPLTPNGKIDRKRLPQPDDELAVSSEYIEPRTDIEKTVAAIWQEVLGVDKVGVKDNFFELGGHSLLVTQIISRIEQQLRVKLTLQSLFTEPTVEMIARVIGDSDTADVRPPLVPVERNQELPLSFAQQRLWLIEQMMPGLPAYNMPMAVRIKGDFDLVVLEQVIDEIIQRHESLRTTFSAHDVDSRQVIHPHKPFRLTIEKIKHTDDCESEILAQVEQDAWQPFDLVTGPVFRAKVLQLADDHVVLLINMHHIVTDGWSLGIFMREVLVLYESFKQGYASPFSPLSVQYADFAYWQRNWLTGEVLKQQISYWQHQLSGVDFLDLPTDKPRPPVQSFSGANVNFTVPTALAIRLNALSRQQEVSLFMTLLAVFFMLLSRYSRQQDICVGTTIANRNHRDLEDIIGFFVNTLVLRADLSQNNCFIDFLKQVKNTTLQAYDYQDLPFERVVEEVGIERSLSQTPLFQVMLVLQNADDQLGHNITGLDSELGVELELELLEPEQAVAKFDLSLFMKEVDNGLIGVVNYNTDLFELSSIERLISSYITLLEAVVTAPHEKLSTFNVVSAQDKCLLQTWNQTERQFPIFDSDPGKPEPSLVSRFEAQVKKHPQRPAVVYLQDNLTYDELNKQANQLANRLIRSPITPGTCVAIYVERSVHTLVAILGAMKTGAAYVPIDPVYPPDRVAHILEDSGAAAVLTTTALIKDLPLNLENVMVLDAPFDDGLSDANLNIAIFPNDLAYVIYTSGTTGQAKGVQMPHRGPLNLCMVLEEKLLKGEARHLRSTLNATIAFDASVQQIVQLLFGATLYLVPEEVRPDPAKLHQFIVDNDIDVMDCTPSQLSALVAYVNSGDSLAAGDKLPSQILVGGEAISETLWQQLCQYHRQQRVNAYNVYGPTECAVDVTMELICDALPRPTIGHPIANVKFYVLDWHQQLAPIGALGELYIGGPCVAKGYLNRQSLTTERFLQNPFEDITHDRIYKTGDLVRFRPDGRLDYIGRADTQVKVRGFRIELGEIETVIKKLDGVKNAAVDVYTMSTGNQVLLAYASLHYGYELDTKTMRQQLRQQLPAYMVPSKLILLDDMPLTANGKINRNGLPRLESDDELASIYVAPVTETQKQLAAIWCEVIGLNRVGIDDNFFEVGGQSLLATQVISRAQAYFQVELDLRVQFEEPTIRVIADHIDEALLAKQLLESDSEDMDDEEIFDI